MIFEEFENLVSFDNAIDFLDIPTYAKKMSVYDTNILNYIGHVGDCLVEQKETELLEILDRL